MTGDMKSLSKYELEKLMQKASRETARVRREFKEKNEALGVGEERFQCYIAALPKTVEMREMMGEDYQIITVLNGWIIKRLR